MSADGIRKRELLAEVRGVLPEAGEDYEGSEMEVWGTVTAAKFDVVDNKDIKIDLKSKKYKCKCFSYGLTLDSQNHAQNQQITGFVGKIPCGGCLDSP
jgi:hypothetical protein